MKTWKKGAIAGGVWGLISARDLFSGFIWNWPYNRIESSLGYYELPAKISFIVVKTESFTIILTILIGALIGSGMGYIIDKYKKARK